MTAVAHAPTVRTLPVLSVEVAGQPLRPSSLAALTELRIHSELGLPTLCELLFSNLQPDVDIASAGETLAVRAARDLLFEGEITAIEYSHSSSRGTEIRIRSYDALQRLRTRQTVRAYQAMTLASLAKELIVAAGLTPGSIDERAERIALPHTIQCLGSDFQLLRSLGAKCGLYPVLQDGRVHLRSLQSEANPLTLRFGYELLSADFEVNTGSGYAAVQTSYWNPARADYSSGQASANLLSRVGPSRQVLNRVGGEVDANLLALAELELSKARQLIFSGIAEGDARLKVGGRVAIQGVAPKMCGMYDLTSVTHRIDSASGFITEISNKPPASPEEPRGASVAIGIVTQVEDPELLGRVRVSLPGFVNTESGWLPVVTSGAGRDRGLLALPSRGDTVLLLLPAGDPSSAIILGGLYGPERPPNLPGDNLKDTKTVQLKDSASNRLTFGTDGIVLHAGGDLTIAAPGRRVRIVADKIDFDKG